MIQFNLLPDVKIKYIKARQLKNKIMTASLLVIAGSVALVLLVGLMQLGQRKNISDLTKDINSTKSSIQSTADLDKILTIQNQLNTLPDLHNKKPITSRFFDYLNKLTPADVKLSTFEMNTVDSAITITGTAPNLETVNRFADTLKFATLIEGDQQGVKAFTDVATTLTRGGQGSNFSISAKYDKSIVDATKNPQLVIPSIISSRSETEKPAQLFENKAGDQ